MKLKVNNIERDKALAKALQSEDKSESAIAFNEIYKLYKSLMFFEASKFTKDYEEAWDLVQEVFIKIAVGKNSYVPTHAFSTWLFRIAHNTFIDYYRKMKLESSLVCPLQSLDVIDEEGKRIEFQAKDNALNSCERLLRKERFEAVYDAINHISPQQLRVTMELSFYKEYTYEEIAKELNVPLGTVKANLFRAREKMKQHLLSTGFEYGRSFKVKQNESKETKVVYN